ncbi:MAG: hypothetical protein OHK0013_08570 [Sandaracinaceae bacterium]
MRALRFVVGGLEIVGGLFTGWMALLALLWRWGPGGLGVLVVLLSLAGALATTVAGGLLVAVAARSEHPTNVARLRVVRALNLGVAGVGLLAALTDDLAALVLWLPLLGLFAGAGWAVTRSAPAAPSSRSQ